MRPEMPSDRAGMRQAGFSLIELMIVVVIVGILAGVAFPAYQGFVSQGYRSTAQADLMALASAMERHRAAAHTYEGAAIGGANTGKPAIFHGHSPSTEPESAKRYDLVIDTVAASGNSYIIIAKPVSGTTQAGDGNLLYYSDGRKAWDKDSSGTIAPSEYCWRC